MHQGECLNSGNSYIHRNPRLRFSRLERRVFSATSDYTRLKEVDAVIIAVPLRSTSTTSPIELHYGYWRCHRAEPASEPLGGSGEHDYPGTTEEVLLPFWKGNKFGLKALATVSATTRSFPHLFAEREDPGNTSVARKDIPR